MERAVGVTISCITMFTFIGACLQLCSVGWFGISLALLFGFLYIIDD